MGYLVVIFVFWVLRKLCVWSCRGPMNPNVNLTLISLLRKRNSFKSRKDMRGGGDSEFAVPGKLALGSPPPSSQSVQIASRPSPLDLGFDKYMRNKEEDKNEKSKKL